MPHYTTPSASAATGGSSGAVAVASRAATPGVSSRRLLSLDALRGFTMFWLIGGRELTLSLVACLYPPFYDAVETQLTHTKWQGFVTWDLIMPIFLFVVGAAMPLAMAKRLEHDRSLGPTYLRIARRVLSLWILGMIAQEIKYEPESLELYSNSLQAIALGYFVTSIAVLHLRLTGQIALFAALLVSYWALLTFVPFAGSPAGTLEQSANFARYVDVLVLGTFRRHHSFTWVLTSLGFSATVLLGAMAGRLFRANISAGSRILWLTMLGLACLAGGWTWSYGHPLNRHLWTSSMILWSGGWSFLLLALFYAIIDLGGFKRWAFPFIVIGANALLAYVLDPAFDRASNFLVLFFVKVHHPVYIDLLSALGEVAFLWIILWYLYRGRIFLRV
jgi:predicted acyltransferase